MRAICKAPAVLALGALGLAACRGGISEQPPVHPVLDMDFQEKLKAQSESEFANWRDGKGHARGMRTPPKGTIMRRNAERDRLAARPVLLRHKDSNGAFVAVNPMAQSWENVERGREKFFIHCAPCHGRTGDVGIVAKIAEINPPIPNMRTDERVSKLPYGEIFEVITNGKGRMPAYAKHLSVEDRWRVAHYVKMLQTELN